MSGESILVVEDNALNLKLVRAVLEDAGFVVRSSGTAEEGVATAVSQPPDLVLMDLQLPGMDGYSGLRALRSDPVTRCVPVLAFTALAMPQDREQVRIAGFDGYVEKPISVRDLPNQVRAALHRPGGSP
jgi:two-component system cell cycle response regulator DivK